MFLVIMLLLKSIIGQEQTVLLIILIILEHNLLVLIQVISILKILLVVQLLVNLQNQIQEVHYLLQEPIILQTEEESKQNLKFLAQTLLIMIMVIV